MAINISRIIKLFDPDQVNETVHVIGAGSVGSEVIIQLSKLGLTDIHVWDFDKVEAHNISNQKFGINHIGMFKTEAIRDIVLENTGVRLSIHTEEVNGSTPLSGVVFVLTDTMSSRKEIFDSALKYKAGVKLMIEGRMGVTDCRLYTINPNNVNEIKLWDNSWYPDSNSAPSACGAKTTVGSTASILANFAIWSYQNYYMNIQGHKLAVKIEKAVMLSTNPPGITLL